MVHALGTIFQALDVLGVVGIRWNPLETRWNPLGADFFMNLLFKNLLRCFLIILLASPGLSWRNIGAIWGSCWPAFSPLVAILGPSSASEFN